MARAFGAFGETVTEPEQLHHAIVEAQAKGGVCLVDARISQTVMSPPYEETWAGNVEAGR